MSAAQRSGVADPATDADVPDDIEQQELPEFPLDVFPESVRDWCEACARFYQVPVDMPATMAVMAAMTAAMHLRVRIHRNWEDPMVAQMVLCAAPSERKTPVFAAAFSPIYRWQKELRDQAKRRKTALQNEIDMLCTTADGEAEPATSGTLRAERIQTLKAEAEAVKARRLYAEDVTPEELMRLLDEHGGQIALLSDEGEVFQAFAGRYASNEAKLAPLLKGWDGRLPLIYDRVGQSKGGGRTNILVESPRVGIAIAGQHLLLQQLHENKSFRQRGVLGRILFVILGERTAERELCPAGIPQRVLDEYQRAIQSLFQREDESPVLLKNRADFGNEWLVPEWLQALRARVESGLLAGGEFESMPDWAGKCVSNLARVGAAIEEMGGGGDDNLAELAEYFVAHAKRALMSRREGAAPTRGTESDEVGYLLDRLTKMSGPMVARGGILVSTRPFGLRKMMRDCQRYRGRPLTDLIKLVDELVVRGHLLEDAAPALRPLGVPALARLYRLVKKNVDR